MKQGRITIPTDKNFAEGTKKYIRLWGADAVRDCDGTELPENVNELAEKVYKTYFLARRGQAPSDRSHRALFCGAVCAQRGFGCLLAGV